MQLKLPGQSYYTSILNCLLLGVIYSKTTAQVALLKGQKGEPGLVGPQGPPGFVGSSGLPGVPGAPGGRGEAGLRGERGSLGDKGDKGDKGDQGLPGERGPKGIIGPVGLAGIKGQTGTEGPIGPPGTIGPVGPVGPAGPPGSVGPVGNVGPRGLKGEPGATGSEGQPGPPGKEGQPGAAGTAGSAGPPGAVGPAGLHGEKGAMGLPGLPGIPGQPGHPGAVGAQGLLGPIGPPGQRGEPGLPGPVGPTGPAGLKGQNGQRGEKGEKGDPGTISVNNSATNTVCASNPCGTSALCLADGSNSFVCFYFALHNRQLCLRSGAANGGGSSSGAAFKLQCIRIEPLSPEGLKAEVQMLPQVVPAGDGHLGGLSVVQSSAAQASDGNSDGDSDGNSDSNGDNGDNGVGNGALTADMWQEMFGGGQSPSGSSLGYGRGRGRAASSLTYSALSMFTVGAVSCLVSVLLSLLIVTVRPRPFLCNHQRLHWQESTNAVAAPVHNCELYTGPRHAFVTNSPYTDSKDLESYYNNISSPNKSNGHLHNQIRSHPNVAHRASGNYQLHLNVSESEKTVTFVNGSCNLRSTTNRTRDCERTFERNSNSEVRPENAISYRHPLHSPNVMQPTASAPHSQARLIDALQLSPPVYATLRIDQRPASGLTVGLGTVPVSPVSRSGCGLTSANSIGAGASPCFASFPGLAPAQTPSAVHQNRPVQWPLERPLTPVSIVATMSPSNKAFLQRSRSAAPIISTTGQGSQSISAMHGVQNASMASLMPKSTPLLSALFKTQSPLSTPPSRLPALPPVPPSPPASPSASSSSSATPTPNLSMEVAQCSPYENTHSGQAIPNSLVCAEMQPERSFSSMSERIDAAEEKSQPDASVNPADSSSIGSRSTEPVGSVSQLPNESSSVCQTDCVTQFNQPTDATIDSLL